MNKQRASKVLANLRELGLGQAIVTDPLSIWYLTGYYTEPYERFLALYLTEEGGVPRSTLFCNRLFPDDGFRDRLELAAK